jgi:hypothetical protein
MEPGFSRGGMVSCLCDSMDEVFRSREHFGSPHPIACDGEYIVGSPVPA